MRYAESPSAARTPCPPRSNRPAHRLERLPRIAPWRGPVANRRQQSLSGRDSNCSVPRSSSREPPRAARAPRPYVVLPPRFAASKTSPGQRDNYSGLLPTSRTWGNHHSLDCPFLPLLSDSAPRGERKPGTQCHLAQVAREHARESSPACVLADSRADPPPPEAASGNLGRPADLVCPPLPRHKPLLLTQR